MSIDNIFMNEALRLAEKAARLGEIPVGAVVVRDGEIIGRGYNQRETKKSAISHAEVIAIEEACRTVGDWRLTGCTLYVTLEPCPMCSGAIVNSRIDRVVFGATDRMAGCCGSLINFNAYPLNHSFVIDSGICESECKAILKEFFETKRKK